MTKGEQHKQWESTYSGKQDYFGARPSDLAYRAVVIFRENGCRKVLELGCGQGRDPCLFAKEGFQVTALDYSESGICQMRQKAKEMCMDGKVECVCQDLRAGIPLPDGSVDAVYSHMLFTMELWEREIQFLLDECRRVLRPGGSTSIRCATTTTRTSRKVRTGARTCGRTPSGSWFITSPRKR